RLPGTAHPGRDEGGKDRHRDGDGTRRRRAARSQAAGAARHVEASQDASGVPSTSSHAAPMTAQQPPQRLTDLMAARDSSLPLAAAALARIADGRGAAALGAVAIASRAACLKLRTRGSEWGWPGPGG